MRAPHETTARTPIYARLLAALDERGHPLPVEAAIEAAPERPSPVDPSELRRLAAEPTLLDRIFERLEALLEDLQRELSPRLAWAEVLAFLALPGLLS